MRVIVVAMLMISCTDATRGKAMAMGSSEVTCYSGGQVIYQGKSSGRVEAEEQSDGWYFQDEATGDFIRISGDCILRNK